MSVYKPGKGRYFHFDFVLKGRRYTGSTGATTPGKAERAEALKREAAGRGELDRPAKNIPTLGQAAATWWSSKSGAKSAKQLLERVTLAAELVGRGKPVNEVTFADVQGAIQKRRGMMTPQKTMPANATVNRDLIATLRPTIKLARKMLNSGVGANVPFPEIDWGELTLPEPKPKPKGLRGEEIALLLAVLPPIDHDFVRFEARYGCRISEMFFSLDDIDIPGRRVTLRERKGDDDHVIPLLPEDVAMLAARISRARAAGLNTVWFRVEGRIRAEHGALKARTPRGMGKQLSLAMAKAELKARGSHSLRHTAGTNMLRSSKNLRTTQRLLGHANIRSTLVYAHVLEDDVRDALDAMSRPVPELVAEEVPEMDTKTLKGKVK